jgi:hypothetical protein
MALAPEPVARFRGATSPDGAVKLMLSDIPDAASVAQRIGPNPGQPQGRNFVLAARIAGQAQAGEILVSSSLEQYTERDRRFRFEPHGEYHFKGLVGEHTVYSVSPR